MPAITFRCPHCAADLKIRDDQITAAPVSCPDCHKLIVVSRDEFGNIAAAAPAPPGTNAKVAKNAKSPAPANSNAPTVPGKPQAVPTIVREEAPAEPQLPPWKRLSRNAMLGIVGSVLALAAIIMGGFLLLPRGSRPDADVVEAADIASPASSQPSNAGNKSSSASSVQKKATVDSGQKAQSSPQPTVTSRLTALGQRVAEYRAKNGRFPSAAAREGLPPNERLSWLAQLVATALQPNQPAPSWNDSWRSQRNERFVRQRMPEFLNPSIDRLTGAENYPATHFAGVAGVGADAADLPVDHPRAGIFGNNRATRIQDIRDGASNTLMVVGVTGDLGSWAANGKPTVRALTQEPYVNGPDGLGTGSPDRMMVLKADGSVQEISAKTDPRILRRMAAMSDGLPLDPKVPGEPGDRSPQPSGLDQLTADVKKQQPAPSGTKPPAGMPKPSATASAQPSVSAPPAVVKKPAPPLAPAAPKTDVAAALGQRVIHFEQKKPVPMRDVLNVLEELVTVPIRGDRQEIADLDDLLQTPISVELENTTVAAILEAVLTRAGLTFQTQPDAIQLHRAGRNAGSAPSP
jgi:Protein of unknown function (DUF1559)